MNTRPIVCLDSDDYSKLANERQLTPELRATRESLIEISNGGGATFVYSSAHLSEMAPLEAKYSTYSNARAALLATLCKRNALISLDRVIQREMTQLRDLSFSDIPVLSQDGTWFPDLSGIFSPVQMADFSRYLEEELRKYPRRERRAMRSMMLKGSTLKPAMRQWLGQATADFDLSNILRTYPMRPEHAQVVARYSMGGATKSSAEAAFLESLRDPQWMMQWFEHHHGQMLPIINWVRSPAKKIISQMQVMVDLAEKKRALELEHGVKLKVQSLTREGWEEMRRSILLHVVNRYFQVTWPEHQPVDKIEDVERFCPGISTGFSALHTSLWTSLQETPRKLLASDFGDCVHAMYSPYITHFRADGYMAPHVAKHAPKSTKVIGRLSDLVSVLAPGNSG